MPHRLSHSVPSFLLALACAAALPGQMRLSIDGGALGKTLRFDLAQKRGFLPFLLLSSGKRARFPLSLIDPRDSRFLEVGLDQPGLWIVGSFSAAGKATILLPVPNTAALAGQGLVHQAISLPGIGRTFDQVSPVGTTMLDLGGAWRLSAKTFLIQKRAWAVEIPIGDGRHLIAGGGTGSLLGLTATNTTEWFDELDRSFKRGPTMRAVRAVHTATRLPSGKWLLAGGVDVLNDPQTSCELFDPKTGTFLAAKPMSFKRMEHSATLLPNGKVLVAGGLSDLNNQLTALSSALKSTEIYDPRTGAWTRGPNMTIPRAGHQALLLKDGRVLFSGGVTWKTIFFFKVPSITKTCEIYDPKTNRFTAVSPMATDRGLHSLVQLANGKVLAIGGVGGPITSGGSARSSCELFDPRTGRWSAAASMASARGLFTTLVDSGGRIRVLGGAQGTLLAPKALTGCEVYDPVKGTWAALPSMKVGRAGQAGFLGGAGASIVIGGGTGASGTAVNTWELLLP